MAEIHFTSTTTRRAVGRPRSKANEVLPVYGLTCGSLSFREGLKPYEVGTIDRALAIIGRTLRTSLTTFSDPAAVKDYMRLALGGEAAERFGVLFLDSQNRALAFEILFNGTLTQTSVILAHNHPSGGITPSKADHALTNTLMAALALVDVRVFDHIIVGGAEALSMAEMGLL